MSHQPGQPFSDQVDARHNNLVAAGALLVVLGSSTMPRLQAVAPITDADGNATNEIAVQFTFLTSTYRVTIERIPD